MNLDHYVPVDEAAALTGLSERHWRRLAVQAAARTSPGQPLALQLAPRTGRGRPTWWIARRFDPRLARCPASDVRDARQREGLHARFPAEHVELAYRRQRWLLAWRQLCRAPVFTPACTERELAARVVQEARAAEPELKISVRSLQAWWQRYQQFGADGNLRGVEGLVPRYCAPDSGDGDGGPGPHGGNRSPAAIRHFYELYHTQQRLTVRTCHEMTLAESGKQGWAWTAGYAATCTWLRGCDDRALTCLMRDGRETYTHKFLPHVEVDYTGLQPGEFYVADHAQFDFWARDERDRPVRLWLTAIEDCRSRCIVGWHIGKSPHQDAILRALLRAFNDWAIPETMRFDNGKDFRSQVLEGYTRKQVRALRKLHGPSWRDVVRHQRDQVTCDAPAWQGVTGELGIKMIYAIPYQPWSKMIERFFGTMHNQFDKTFATYCGNSPGNRPDGVDDIRKGRIWLNRQRGLSLVDPAAVPTIDQVRARLAQYLTVYHHQAHRGSGMDGCSPLAVWQTATRLRRAGETELLFMMQTRGLFKVGSNGVSVTIGGGRLRYGARSAALRPFKGREVLVAVDPGDVSRCWAFTADSRRLLGVLQANERVPALTDADDLREVLAAVNRERKEMHRSRAGTARRRMTTAQRVAEHQREQAVALQATGTDSRVAGASIAPVHTGFEGVSIPARTPVEPPAPSKYDDLDLTQLAYYEDEDAAAAEDPYADLDLETIALAGRTDDDGGNLT